MVAGSTLSKKAPPDSILGDVGSARPKAGSKDKRAKALDIGRYDIVNTSKAHIP